MAILSKTLEVLPSKAIGSVTAPSMKLSGSKLLGVTPDTFLKSKVSTWLGAPRMKMKITLEAVFLGCTEPRVSVSPRASRSARKKPPTPVSVSRKKCRRVLWGRSKKLWCVGWRRCTILSNRSRSFMAILDSA